MQPLRIAMKPQTWLFVANVIIQPFLLALGILMLRDGSWIMGGFLTLIGASLFAVGVLALKRTRGRVLEIVLDADTIELPNPLSGKVQRIPLASLKRGQVMELRTANVASFWQLTLAYDREGRERATVVSSQFVGKDGFDSLCAALRERGIAIA
jgi:hypothetical protein